MQWLLEGTTAAPRELALERQSEDGASVRLPGDGWLLWREPPQFATLAPEAAARYSAGPGLLLVPMQAGEVRIEQHPSTGMRAATILGGLSTLVLLLWLALGLAFGGTGDPAGIFGATGRALRRIVTGWLGNADK